MPKLTTGCCAYTAIYWFLEAAYMQANNRLLDYFNSIYRYATPTAPNIVE